MFELCRRAWKSERERGRSCPCCSWLSRVELKWRPGWRLNFGSKASDDRKPVRSSGHLSDCYTSPIPTNKHSISIQHPDFPLYDSYNTTKQTCTAKHLEHNVVVETVGADLDGRCEPSQWSRSYVVPRFYHVQVCALEQLSLCAGVGRGRAREQAPDHGSKA